jgi:hypothetical protein
MAEGNFLIINIQFLCGKVTKYSAFIQLFMLISMINKGAPSAEIPHRIFLFLSPDLKLAT